MMSRSLMTKAMFSTAFWGNVKTLPKDAIFGVNEEYRNDPAKFKVNLTVGAYKDDKGQPFLLNCVKEATKQYYLKNVNHEYLPIGGNASFIKKSLELAYSKEDCNLKKGNIAGFQSLSGTGALRISMEFLKHHFPGNKTIYFPGPTWANHRNIAQRAMLPIKDYRYYDNKNKRIDMEGLLTDLDNAPSKSIILLHACAHNPTGMDLNPSQWKEVIEVIKSKQHFPLLDMAYQGFASGDPMTDGFAVREFSKNNISLALCQSYAKNFGLYGERIGCCSFLCQNTKETIGVRSQMENLIRGQYSSPAKFGSFVVDYIFNSKTLTDEWMREIKVMSQRIQSMRMKMYDGLIKVNQSKQDWQHIIKQIGMFAFTGVSPSQVNTLKKKYHIFLTSNGRISVAGLNSGNIDYVAKAFHEVTKH